LIFVVKKNTAPESRMLPPTLEQRNILTINRGSGTLKAGLYELADLPRLVLSIKIDRTATREARITITNSSSNTLLDSSIGGDKSDSDFSAILKWLSEQGYASRLAGIGHRIVHGGPHYTQALKITPEVLTVLQGLAPLDPDHTPEEMRGIQFFAGQLPDTPQIACFDTAFHACLPKVARIYALPRKMYEEGIRRYGFHGLSCESVLQQLRATDAALAERRLIIAHLGNGCSMTAVHNGKSVDTSMGFTPLEGLVMSTRSGDIDAAVVPYLQEQNHTSPENISALLNKQSGLLGLSGTSGDMRDLLEREARDDRAAEAIELFCYRAKKFVGAYAAALGGLDMLIFAGGIGENAPQIRERICSGLEFLGIELDPPLNRSNALLISAQRSRVRVKVIKTDEDSVIAQHVLAVIEKNGP
jgi:acetate kinase